MFLVYHEARATPPLGQQNVSGKVNFDGVPSQSATPYLWDNDPSCVG